MEVEKGKMRVEEEEFLSNKGSFNENLHEWYKKYHRKLPWRTAPSLYRTVVSEFMLQQTQVDTMIPYFERWLEVFPDFKLLADASEEAVVKAWEGLGYYSRARNLHKLAKEIVGRGEIPRSPKEWIEFPGVGPYTAAAITSIGFSYPAAVVDGNVIRILTRLSANEMEFKDNSVAVKALTGFANALLNERDPNTHNQAVMELGATVCTRANPLCTICPVVSFCESAKRGIAEELPRLKSKKIEQVKVNRMWMMYEGRLLLQKIASDAKRLANMYELPEVSDDLKQLVEGKAFAVKKRGISNQRIEESIYRGKMFVNLEWLMESYKDLEWIGVNELSSVTLSGPHRRWVNEILGQDID